MNDNNQNPFQALSKIFIENQKTFDSKVGDLRNRTRVFAERLSNVVAQLETDPFSADLNLYLNIEEESRLIFVVAKELEVQKDKILKSIDLLEASNKIKLN